MRLVSWKHNDCWSRSLVTGMGPSRNDGLRRRALLLSAGLGIAGPGRSQAHAADDAPPPFRSQVGQFILVRPRLPVPSQPIRLADGTLIDFAALAGNVIVLNFWATWCVPCVVEMPSLDRLAALMRGSAVVVLPIAMDSAGATTVRAFYTRHGLTHLDLYVDSDRQVGHLGQGGQWDKLFPLAALPTTYLIDPHGYVVGYVPGAATWDPLRRSH